MRRCLFPVALVASGVLLLCASPLQGQVLAKPVLDGKVFVGDSVLRQGRVVLHHLSPNTQGEVDSVRIARDGTFSFKLPTVPDSAHSEIYFASVRYAGILYFGPALTMAVQLDSLYEIHTWDTTMVAPTGTPLTVETRNIFLQQDSGRWDVTDLFQIINDGKKTLVAHPGGLVWRYPLAAGATNAVMAQSGVLADAESFKDGDLVVRAPLSPGEQLFVARYQVPDPYLTLRLPGLTEQLNILVREPAPPLNAPGFTLEEPIQMDAGTTYRHYEAEQLRDGVVRLTKAAAPRPPPVRWYAVILSLLLAGVALWALRKGAARGLPRPARSANTRQALLMEVAELDEAFEARKAPSPEERKAYEVRRRELLRRLRALG
ncbi:MAG: hypothetical protein LJF06_18580 [Gemmatimonadetes bacterium]|nr:hypothetical protein [Gemmatimonadota bacterium]